MEETDLVSSLDRPNYINGLLKQPQISDRPLAWKSTRSLYYLGVVIIIQAFKNN
jgi:hypothetical protein